MVPIGVLAARHRQETGRDAEALRMALAGLLRKAETEPGLDVLREGVRVLAQAVMELEVEQHVGAARHERTPERSGQRNGYRDRSWDTRVGTVELRVPQRITLVGSATAATPRRS